MSGSQFFDPQTGNSCNFGPGQEPPAGWRELKPVSDPLAGIPSGSTVAWLPGCEPQLFVDPATGENRWIHGSGEEPREWLPLRASVASPPPTQVERRWYDPLTGKSYVFGPDQSPPAGWKKLKPVPSPTPFLPPGLTATWIPGRGSRTYVNPDSGDVQWADPVKGAPAGWIALQLRFTSPPLTECSQEYFDPTTGESQVFRSGEEPPPKWKKLRPRPPQVPALPLGSTVTWLPGLEPVLYVDPDTGEQMWVSPPTKPPAVWIELLPPVGAPPSVDATSAGRDIRKNFV